MDASVLAYFVTEQMVKFTGILFCGKRRFAALFPRRKEIGFSAPASLVVNGPVMVFIGLLLLACLLFPL
jgi:hypothetical protein